jgi:hypothetical protein
MASSLGSFLPPTPSSVWLQSLSADTLGFLPQKQWPWDAGTGWLQIIEANGLGS